MYIASQLSNFLLFYLREDFHFQVIDAYLDHLTSTVDRTYHISSTLMTSIFNGESEVHGLLQQVKNFYQLKKNILIVTEIIELLDAFVEKYEEIFIYLGQKHI